MHVLEDFFEPSLDNLPVGILQICIIMAICCILVMVPIDQCREASRLDMPVVYVLTIGAFYVLLQVSRFGALLSIVFAACLELLSAYLLHKKKGQPEESESGQENEDEHHE